MNQPIIVVFPGLMTIECFEGISIKDNTLWPNHIELDMNMEPICDSIFLWYDLLPFLCKKYNVNEEALKFLIAREGLLSKFVFED
jgi:hypothetical protein